MKTHQAILDQVAGYYDRKIAQHGAVARGVDWSSPQSQGLRFEKLLLLCDRTKRCSINDYGCGYGALADHLREQNYSFSYHGFDISDEMIVRAAERHWDASNCVFSSDESQLAPSDYTLASGIFNVKLDRDQREWTAYVLDTLATISSLSTRGFAFNCLTHYVDFKRDHLYYADPCFYFDYCQTHFSRQVSLLDDYGLHEFTLLVRM